MRSGGYAGCIRLHKLWRMMSPGRGSPMKIDGVSRHYLNRNRRNPSWFLGCNVCFATLQCPAYGTIVWHCSLDYKIDCVDCLLAWFCKLSADVAINLHEVWHYWESFQNGTDVLEGIPQTSALDLQSLDDDAEEKRNFATCCSKILFRWTLCRGSGPTHGLNA